MSVPNYITVVASTHIADASGGPMARGTLTVTAVDGTGKKIPFVTPDGILVSDGQLSRDIVAGQLTKPLTLANPAATNPVGIGYTFVFLNKTTLQQTVFPSVAITADGSGNFNLTSLPLTPASGLPIVYVTGPAGPSGAATLSLTALTSISANLVVASSAGGVVIADQSNPAHIGKVLGIATASTLSGAAVPVLFDSPITNNAWTWTLGLPVFLGTGGALTQTPPVTGFLQVIGTPISATTLLVGVQPPISLT